jgi:uncharacterized protein
MAAAFDTYYRVVVLDGSGRSLNGVAVPFDSLADIHDQKGRYQERILPGAFTAALSRRRPKMMFEHGQDARVGKTPIGSFDRVWEEADGLHVSGQLFDNELVRPLADAARSGELNEWSINFKTASDGSDEKWTRSGGRDIRTIHRAQLPEISLVNFGAYQTTATSRNSPADRGRRLRELGIIKDEPSPADLAAQRDRAFRLMRPAPKYVARIL